MKMNTAEHQAKSETEKTQPHYPKPEGLIQLKYFLDFYGMGNSVEVILPDGSVAKLIIWTNDKTYVQCS